MAATVVNNSADLFGVVASVFGSAPNTGNAEGPASALWIVVRAVEFSPSVRAADGDTPVVFLGVFEGCFNFRFGMGASVHESPPASTGYESRKLVVK